MAALLRWCEQRAPVERDLSGVLPHPPRELCTGAAYSAPDRLGGHSVAATPQGSAGIVLFKVNDGSQFHTTSGIREITFSICPRPI